jgi:HSP20 family molecular chaperone IbpA
MEQQQIFSQGKQHKTWKTSLHLPGFKKDEVLIKVDPIQHVLCITAKHRTNPWQTNTAMAPIPQSNVKCMLPVPENVGMDTLRVRMDTKAGQLLVKGPIQYNTGNQLWQQRKKNLFPVNAFPVKPCSLKETFSTNVVKDEESGKWKMMLNINAMNFQRDDIQVNYQEEEKILVVEMRRENIKPPQMASTTSTQKQVPIALKMVREEILLPEEVNAKELNFNVDNGVLCIEMPLLREPSNKSKPQQDNQENQEDKQTKLSKKMRQNKQNCEENKDWIHAVWPF